MASSSAYPSMIQFPCLPSVSYAWDAPTDRHRPAQPLPPRMSRSLKQSRSTESLTQRKDRVEFLRQREWTRRVAAGGDHSNVSPRRRARTYSWEDIVAAADAAASNFDYSPSALPSYPYPGRPDTIDETDEALALAADEPYVIYTATPRPAAPPVAHQHPAPHAYPAAPAHTPGAVIYSTASPTSSPSPSPSPTLPPTAAPAREPPMIGIGGPYFNARRASWRGPHSRHSSLSSISEEDEGLARL